MSPKLEETETLDEVAVFKDRVEIYNPGQFPEDHEPEDFIKGDEKSILRNPLIANTLYLSADIERWASGLKRIHDACKEEGVKVEFKKIKSGFVVVFHRQPASSKEKLGEKWSEKWSELGLTERQIEILVLINENPKIPRKQLSEKLNINQSAVQRHLEKLKEKGILKRIGPAKGGSWKILESGKND